MENMICNICLKEKSSEEFRRLTGLKNKFNKGCRECIAKSSARYNQNKEEMKAYQKAYRASHPDYQSLYRKQNLASKKDWENGMYDADPKFKWKKLSRERLRGLIRKSFEFETLLGCSFDEFKKHIESRWEPGMNWSNYGRGQGMWSLDHIKAIDHFEIGDESANHFTNLQPLWYSENSRKGSKL